MGKNLSITDDTGNVVFLSVDEIEDYDINLGYNSKGEPIIQLIKDKKSRYTSF